MVKKKYSQVNYHYTHFRSEGFNVNISFNELRVASPLVALKAQYSGKKLKYKLRKMEE